MDIPVYVAPAEPIPRNPFTVGWNKSFMVLLFIAIWCNFPRKDIHWTSLRPLNYIIHTYSKKKEKINRGADSTRITIIFKRTSNNTYMYFVYSQSTATAPNKYGFFVTLSFERIDEKITASKKKQLLGWRYRWW